MENNYSILLPIPKFANYQDISQDSYYTYFTNNTQNGGSISDIILYHKDLKTNNYLRRGGGFWSFLGNLARKSLPFINKFILPEAVNIGQSLLEKQQQKGSISKKDFSDVSKDSIKRVVKKVITGSGKKRKYNRKIIKKLKKNNKRKRKIINKKIGNKKNQLNKKIKHLDNIFSSI